MNEHVIYPSEVLFLIAWLSCPAWFVAAASVVIFVRLMRLLSITWALMWIACITLLSIPLTLVLWTMLPLGLLPSSTMPDSWPAFPPFFLPAYLSMGLLVATFIFVLKIVRKNAEQASGGERE